MRIATLTIVALLGAGCSGAKAPDLDQAPPPAQLDANAPQPGGAIDQAALRAAADGAWRSDANKARNAARHPAETLAFFGIRKSDTVVEISPGGGWYTEVLAPYLAQGGGTYVAALADPASSERAAQAVAAFKHRFTGEPYGDVQISVFGRDGKAACAPGTADAVLTFRNVHNWMGGDFHDNAYKSFYECLKPGGVLGLVEHRREESDTPQDPKGTDGYIKESYVIAAAERAGFKLAGKSEINANPKDTKDHPFGVWTLPPVARTSDFGQPDNPNFDRAKYDAIGESDRMTLKFVKPS